MLKAASGPRTKACASSRHATRAGPAQRTSSFRFLFHSSTECTAGSRSVRLRGNTALPAPPISIDSAGDTSRSALPLILPARLSGDTSPARARGPRTSCASCASMEAHVYVLAVVVHPLPLLLLLLLPLARLPVEGFTGFIQGGGIHRIHTRQRDSQDS